MPQYRRHLEPYVIQVEKQIQPYAMRARAEYASKVAPYIHLAATNLHRLQHKARPYIVLAAHKTYDGYQYAKPYAIPVLQRIQQLLVQFTHFLGEQRRQYVDPHVKKIWERVNELGNGGPTPLARQAEQARNTVVSSVSIRSALKSSLSLAPEPSEAVVGSASPVLLDVVSGSKSLPAVTATANSVEAFKEHMHSVSSASSVASSVAEHVISSVSSADTSVKGNVASSATSMASVAPSVVIERVVPTLSSIDHESVVSPVSLHSEVSSTASSLGDAVSSPLSQAPASVADAVPAALPTASSAIPEVRDSMLLIWCLVLIAYPQVLEAVASAVAPSLSTGAVAGDDDPDLASILADLGLDEDFLTSDADSEALTEASEPVAEQESEEEKAEDRKSGV